MATNLIIWYGAPTIINGLQFIHRDINTFDGVKSNTSVSSGRVMCEVYINKIAGSYTGVGITDDTTNVVGIRDFGLDATEYAYLFTAQKRNSGTITNYGTAFNNGSVVGILIDMDAKKLSFCVNGVWQGFAYSIDNINNAVIATRTYAASGTDYSFNFGQSRFRYPMYSYAPFDPTSPLYEYKREYPSDVASPTWSYPVLDFEGMSFKGKTGTRITRIFNGVSADAFISDRVLRNSIGLNSKINYGQRYVSKQSADTGKLLDPLMFGARSKNSLGKLLTPIFDDANAIDHVNLVVTPTNTFFGSWITVDAKNNLYDYGKYRLYMNKAIAIPFLSDFSPIDHVSFPMDVSLLPLGSTPCRLEYLFPNGNKEYIDFDVTKDANNRQAAVTTLYWYSGGFINTGDSQYITYDNFKTGILTTNGVGKSATLETTQYTSIDLSHVHAIFGISLECDFGCMFLVSLDDKNTWHSFSGGEWVQRDPNNIGLQGMNKDAFTAVTKEQWDLIFQQTRLDIMMYMDQNLAASVPPNSSETTFFSLGRPDSGYTFTIPQDTLITKTQITGNSSYTYYVYYTDGTSSTVAKTTSAPVILTIPEGKVVSSIVLPHLTTVINDIVSATCVSRYAWFKSLSVLFLPNYPPAITDIDLLPPETHTDSILSAHIKDAEGDPAYYQVSINGEPMTDFISDGIEYDIAITIPSSMTIVGTNAITIQTFDGLTYGSYTTYLTKVDAKPTISGILDKLKLTALITDADAGDTVRYRILLNGVVKIDWSHLIEAPISVWYTIRNRDINIGVQNTLTLEAQDNLGEITTVDFDFVGQLYNLKSRYSYIL